MIIAISVVVLLAAVGSLLLNVQVPFIIILGVVLTSAWLVRRPAHALGAMVALQVWGVLSLTSGGLTTPAKLASFVSIAATIVQVLRVGRLAPLPRWLAWGMAWLVCQIFLTEISSDYGASLSSLSEFINACVWVLIVTQVVKSREDVRVVAVLQVIGLLFMTVYVEREVGWSRMMAGVVRARGPAGQPNMLAEHLARVTPLALAVLVDRYNGVLLRAVAGVSVVGAVYMLFAAASRGGTLGALAGLIVFAAVASRTWGGRLIGIAMLLLALGVAVSVAPRSFEERVVGSLTNTDSEVDITSHRREQLIIARALISDRPWFGYGSNGFILLGGKEMHTSYAVTAHSSVAGAAVAYGVPAAVLAVVLLLSGMWQAVRAANVDGPGRSYAIGVAAGLSGGFVASLSSNSLFLSALWFLAGCGHVLGLHARRRGTEAEAEPGPPIRARVGELATERNRA